MPYLLLLLLLPLCLAQIDSCDPGKGWDDGSSQCTSCPIGYYSLGNRKQEIAYWENDPPCTAPGTESCWIRVDNGRALRSGTSFPSSFELSFTMVEQGTVDIDVRYVLTDGAVLSVEDPSGWPAIYFYGTALKRLAHHGVSGATFFNPGNHKLVFKVEDYVAATKNVAYLHSITLSGVKDTCMPCPPGTYSDTAGSSLCLPCASGCASDVANRSEPCPACSTDHYTASDSATECKAFSECTGIDQAYRLGPCGTDQITTVEPSEYPLQPACMVNGVAPTPYTLPPEACRNCVGSLHYDGGYCTACRSGSYRPDGALLHSGCRNCTSGSASLNQLVYNQFNGPWSDEWTVYCSGRCKSNRDAWVRDGNRISTSKWHGDAFLVASLAVNHTSNQQSFSFECVTNGSSLYFMVDDEVKQVISGNKATRISYSPTTTSTTGTVTYSWMYNGVGGGYASVSNIVAVGTQSGGARRCYYCDKGYYSPVKGMSECARCPRGSFSGSAAEFGMVSCSECPANYFTLSDASESCLPCGSGTKSNKARGSTDCVWGNCQFLIHGVNPVTKFDLAPLPRSSIMYNNARFSFSLCSRFQCDKTSALACMEDYSLNYGQMLDITLRSTPKVGLLARFLYGDSCPGGYRETEVDLVCSIDSGVGNPRFVSLEYSPSGCPVVKLEWLTQHACPICLNDDIVKVQGQCVDRFRLESTTKLRPCYTTAPMPPVSKVPCAAESPFSWVAGVSIGGGGALLMAAVGVLWVRNRRLYSEYRKLLNGQVQEDNEGEDMEVLVESTE